MAVDVVGSKIPAENAYGQNGYPGPSSVTPDDDDDAACGQSGFLPATVLPTGNEQTRDVGKSNVQPAFGMKRQTNPTNLV